MWNFPVPVMKLKRYVRKYAKKIMSVLIAKPVKMENVSPQYAPMMRTANLAITVRMTYVSPAPPPPPRGQMAPPPPAVGKVAPRPLPLSPPPQ